MNLERIIQSVKEILKDNLKAIEQKNNSCPFFQSQGNCAIVGWISHPQETENFCESPEFITCGNFAKAILKNSAKEKFFIYNLKQELMYRVDNFIISGSDIFLEEELADLFVKFKLKRSISSDKVKDILDRILGKEKEDVKKTIEFLPAKGGLGILEGTGTLS